MSVVDVIVSSAVRGMTGSARSAWPSLAIDEWARLAGQAWPFGYRNPFQFDREEIDGSFDAVVNRAYRANGVVFAVELARIALFCQARFVFRRWIDAEPQKPFTMPALDILNVRPWEGGTTIDLLTRLLQAADFAGTGFVVHRMIGGTPELRVPRPDYMTILLGSNEDPAIDARDLDATIIGYLYHPGGRYSDKRPVALMPNQVAHFIPTPDPLYRFWGIPWILPVVANIQGLQAASEHKLRFFENGASPQVIVTLGDKAGDPKKFREWIEVFEQEHSGVSQAYKTMYMAAGANAQVVGSNLRQLDLRASTDIDEVTIANAGGVPAAIVGLSEGLQGSTLNTGNYGATMRRFANLFARPAWQNVAGSMQRIVTPPQGAELWYADKHIPALQEDVKDTAQVLDMNASAIQRLFMSGAQWDAIIDAVSNNDLQRLKGKGSDLPSVQLQAKGTVAPTPPRAVVLPAEQRLLGPGEVRCSGCGSLLAEAATPPYRLRCHKSDCKTLNEVA